MRKRTTTIVERRYALESENIFDIKDYCPSWQEKEMQNNIYDALTDGHHGQREEYSTPGYRFKMELHSHKGW
eukprot:14539819-Heterocapsa_arctica.AAC.1